MIHSFSQFAIKSIPLQSTEKLAPLPIPHHSLPRPARPPYLLHDPPRPPNLPHADPLCALHPLEDQLLVKRIDRLHPSAEHGKQQTCLSAAAFPDLADDFDQFAHCSLDLGVFPWEVVDAAEEMDEPGPVEGGVGEEGFVCFLLGHQVAEAAVAVVVGMSVVMSIRGTVHGGFAEDW